MSEERFSERNRKVRACRLWGHILDYQARIGLGGRHVGARDCVVLLTWFKPGGVKSELVYGSSGKNGGNGPVLGCVRLGASRHRRSAVTRYLGMSRFVTAASVPFHEFTCRG